MSDGLMGICAITKFA